MIVTDSLVGSATEHDETQLAISGSQFLHTDYMQDMLRKNDEQEKAAREVPTSKVWLEFLFALSLNLIYSIYSSTCQFYIPCKAESAEEFPEVPEHPAITRRGQFAVKNSLQQDKEEKKQAKAKAKASAKPKPRGRPKKCEEQAEASPVSTKQKRKAANVTERRANKRKAKAARVARAMQLNQQQENGTVKDSKGKKRQQQSKEYQASSRTKTKQKKQEAVATKDNKTKAKNTKADKAAKKASAKKSSAKPDDNVKEKVMSILIECQSKGCTCENHRDDVLNLSACKEPKFTFSTYWTRGDVGLKTLVESLPPALRKPNAKKSDQQFAYFGGGPCVYVNLFLMTELVKP